MSVKSPVIVSGEAPETDSEDETPTPTRTGKHISVHGAVILGEDSESEHESESKEAVAEAAQSENHHHHRENKNYNSLLHRKLKECNLKLRWDLENFVQGNVSEACKTLHTLEQELINSQLTMQSAITSLQALNANSNKINKKLHSIVSSSFLSNVKI